MYIHAVSHYIPSEVVDNEHFREVNGLSSDWITERTGIRQRHKAAPEENTNTMAIEAVRKLFEDSSINPTEINLIVGATYTPHDTIVTLAHAVQSDLGVADIPVISISTACSSLINAVEVVEGYFAMNKASLAVVVVAEHNTAYNNESDKMSGHLWGDGAAALLISKERLSDNDMTIHSVVTGGAATSGKATTGVMLRPLMDELTMPHGRDVFIHACQYMPKVSLQVLEKSGLTIDDVDYLIPHQANLRISMNVLNTLQLPESKLLSNIQRLGNTGCSGCGIALSENRAMFQKGQKIVLTVFGGGYSFGAMLVEA